MTRDGRHVYVTWEGRSRPRVDVIRELFAAGVPVAQIARRLNLPYQIAYMSFRGQPLAQSGGQVDAHEPLADADAILLGCVSQKNASPMPAKDLYRSELCRRRRLWAEASGKPWWIVSAEYGLVGPDQEIAPYDTRIGLLPLNRRQELAAGVVRGLERAMGSLNEKKLELHAGDEYYLTIAPALAQAGAFVYRPLEGLRIGEQLGWYGQRLALPRARLQQHVQSPRTASVSRVGNGRGLSRTITEAFMAGTFDLSGRPGAPPSGWAGMPEVRAVGALREAGATDVDVRLFLTFNAAMDRARDADKLANAAVRMWRKEPWTIQPGQVVDRPLGDLADALRSSGVSQRHAADAFAWRVIAETLREPAATPAAHAAIYEGQADAKTLMAEVVGASPGGTARFRLLGGPKISATILRYGQISRCG